MAEGRCALSSYVTGQSPNMNGVCSPPSHVRYVEKGDRLISKLGGFTINAFSAGEPAGYPTLCKGRFVAGGEACYLFEEPASLNVLTMLREPAAAGVIALTLECLARRGAVTVCLPVELPAASLAVLAAVGGVDLEVQVFGRLPLALSARCYHARSRRRHKGNCQYVCSDDPDGPVVETLDGRPFLAVNGIQTMSYTYCNLAGELEALSGMGVRRSAVRRLFSGPLCFRAPRRFAHGWPDAFRAAP